MKRRAFAVAVWVAAAGVTGVGTLGRVGSAWAQSSPGESAGARRIAEHPERPEGYEALALAALAAHRWDDAIDTLRVGVVRVPSFARGYYLLAVAYRGRGDWAEAATYYRMCVSLHHQELDSLYGLGRVLEAMGDRAAAIEALKRYVAEETDPAKARFVAEARTALLGLQAGPASGPASGSATTGDTERAAGPSSLDETVTRLRHAIDAEGEPAARARLHNEVGTALYRGGRFAEAAAAFEAATRADPSYAVAWFNLSNTQRKAGFGVFAVRSAERFLALAPGDPDGWFAVAQAREAAGDVPGARVAYERYLAVEKRPNQQRLQDRARAALATLPSKPAADADELLPPSDTSPTAAGATGPMGRGKLKDLRDPFDGPTDADDLVNPFHGLTDAPPAEAPGDGGRGRAEEYAQAVAALRKALAAQAEKAAARYERGMSLLAAGKVREAAAALDGLALDDPAVQEARGKVQRLRDKARAR